MGRWMRMRVLPLSEGTIGFRPRDPLALRERTQRCMRAMYALYAPAAF